MKWCCGAFHGHFENAGHRGLAVFFVKEEPVPVPMFVLQVRAVEGEARGLAFDGSISLVTETGLQFCPWCGRRLMSWYKKNLVELTKTNLRVPVV